MRNKNLTLMLLAIASLAIAPVAVLAGGQGGAAGVTPAGTVFTYQGRLNQAGVPVNSTCDFEFSLWDAAIGPSQIGLTLSVNSVTVTDGLFTVHLDFGSAAFNGNARWLEIAVRCPAGAGVFTTLSPRQPLTPAPYAVRSLAPWAVSPTNKSDIFYETGNVGIGTTSPSWPLHVSTTAIQAVLGETDSTSVLAVGVLGRVNSTSPGVGSAAVRGENLSTTIFGFGVWGSQDGPGWGVYGSAPSGIGVRGESASGSGVFGLATAGAGSTYGVFGQSQSPNGNGVFGLAAAASGTNFGVFGKTNSPEGIGVLGQHSATSGTAPAVLGETDSTSPSAVGVLGRVNSTSPGRSTAAVRGENLSTTSSGVGVWGSQDGSGLGVFGSAPSGNGVRGASGSGSGVFGWATDLSGVNYGVYGRSDSPSGYGVYSQGNVCTTGFYQSCSDGRFKENVQTLADSLEKVLKLRGVQFDWKRDEFPEHNFSRERQVGLVAQEVAEVLPEVVAQPNGNDGFYSVSYGRLVPVLVEAIKELHGQVEHKDSQITELRARLTALETLVEQLASPSDGGAP